MECTECGVEKLSREFPRMDLSDECDHPRTHCLRCILRLLEKHTACPFPGCVGRADTNFIQQCREEVDFLFPAVPTSHADFAFYEPSSGYQKGSSSASADFLVIATLLSGERCSVACRVTTSIWCLKGSLEGKLGVKAFQQKLFCNERELKDFEYGKATTLGTYGVLQTTHVQVHVQLLELPDSLQKIVFDLHWEYTSRKEDYLDATAFFYDRWRELAISDYLGNHNCVVKLDRAVEHSGDVMDFKRKTGHHLITINFKYLPAVVNTIFFTLSSWRAPNIGRFRNPALSFYDSTKPDVQLCENFVTKAPGSRGIIMCKAQRGEDGRWSVEAIGRPVAGNAAKYGPIRKELKQIAHSQFG